MVLLIVKIFWIWLHNVWYTFSPHMHKAHLYNYWKNPIHSRPYGAPFVSEVRESGPWRTSVTGRRDGLLKQTAQIPGADCCRSSSEWAVGADRGVRPWRAAEMNFWNKRHRFLAPIVSKVYQIGPWEQAVDGRPWRAVDSFFSNKKLIGAFPICKQSNLKTKLDQNASLPCPQPRCWNNHII